ncbi:MAG: hypothetical protein AAGE94_19490, partial [Acidobacteriota bacterium]
MSPSSPHVFAPRALLGVACALAFASIVLVAPSFDASPLDDPRRKIFEGVLGWPEDHRAFYQDGPGFLLNRDAKAELFDLGTADRGRWIDEFLADPDASTPENELLTAVERRRRLVAPSFTSFQDVRAQLLFLHGEPTERMIVDCTEVYKPLELWTYGPLETGQTLILYQDRYEQPWKLWSPFENKRSIYNEEMAYFLVQWEEFKNRISGGRRFDREICEKESKRVDEVTGVDGLFGFMPDRPKDSDFAVWLRPPEDLVAWARQAAATPIDDEEWLTGGSVAVFYPERADQRMKTLIQIEIEDPSQLEVFEEGDSRQFRLVLDGHLERSDSFFEEFRVRFQVPVPEDGLSGPLALQSE